MTTSRLNLATLATLLIIALSALRLPVSAQQQAQQPRRSSSSSTTPPPPHQFLPSNHTRNAAVLVSSSRYWHNYRHVSNVLHIYNLLKTEGKFRDEDIILMIADDLQCDGRNPYVNAILPDQARGGTGRNLYGPNVEVDYRGTDVTVDNFLRVLTGRHPPGEAPSRKLDLTPDTNLLVMLTGHGGDQFFKFQDGEELTTQDVLGAFRNMHRMGRYNEVLFVADTCQAFTMNPTQDKLLDASDLGTIPNVMTVASSLEGQNSYAHHSDAEIGQSVVDRYTHYFTENVKNVAATKFRGDARVTMSKLSVKDAWVDAMGRVRLGADVGWTDRGCRRRMDEVPLCDFLCDKRSGVVADDDVDALLIRESYDFGSDVGETAALLMEQRRRAAAENAEDARRDDGEESPVGGGGGQCDSDGSEKDEVRKPTKRGGRTPSDPLFLVSVAAVLFAVRISSRLR